MDSSIDKYDVFLVKKETIYHPKQFLGGMWDDVSWSAAYYEDVYHRGLIKDKITWEEAKKIEKEYILKDKESISINKIYLR